MAAGMAAQMGKDRKARADSQARGLATLRLDRQRCARHLFKVKQQPGTKPNGTNPDYEIEGRVFDCYAPSTKNPRNIWDYIKKEKVDKGQADRVVLNLEDSAVDVKALQKQFAEWEIDGLKEIIIIRGGKATPFWP